MESNGVCNFLIVLVVGCGWISTQIRPVVCTIPTEIRLVEGNSPFDGIVEVQIGSTWERVCQMGWSYEMADHVCQHLGFSEGSMLPRSEASVDPKSISIPKVSCTLSPDGVVDCQRVQVSCSMTAGVTCNHPGYLGCYKHTRQRPIASDLKYANDFMTIETCLEFCRTGRFRYAGLAFGEECLCDNRGPEFWASKKTANSKCVLPCKGDRWEACGGMQQARFYESRLGICGGKQQSSDRYIASPLFPGDYDRGSICTWKISRDVPNTESFTINFVMFNLLPGDTLRITEVERKNWALPRSTILVLTSQMSHMQGSSVNVSGAGFYVEFQSALSTRGQGDPRFLLTYHPNLGSTKPKHVTALPLNTTNTATTNVSHITLTTTTKFTTLFSFGDDSKELESTTHPTTSHPITTSQVLYKSNKLIAAVSTVSIGGGLIAFWGLILVVMFLRKRMPLNRLKFVKDSEADRTSRNVASYCRSSFDSDFDSPCETPTCDSTPISGVNLIYTTNDLYSSTYFRVPRRNHFKTASRVLSNFVDHIYSSVYTSGRTMKVKHLNRGSTYRPSKLLKKPSVAPKPDIVPMVEKNGVNDDFNEPWKCTGASQIRISMPVYQNLVKYQKNKTLPADNQLKEPGRICVSNSQPARSLDNDGYLVPAGAKSL